MLVPSLILLGSCRASSERLRRLMFPNAGELPVRDLRIVADKSFSLGFCRVFCAS